MLAKSAISTGEEKAPFHQEQKVSTSKLAVKTQRLVETTRNIDVNDLVLSSDNPRIRQSLKRVFPKGFQGVPQAQTQSAIKKIIWDEWDARSLKKRILHDGQVWEDVYVQKKGNKYVIKEGNSRYVAIDSILSDIKSGKLTGITENDYRKMSCKVIRDNATAKEIRMFITQLHVAGKLPWDKLSQAEEVYLMLVNDCHTIQNVADHLSTSISKVKKLYDTYEKTVAYGKLYGGNFEKTYVYWDEFSAKANLQAEAQRDPSFIDKLMKWMDTGIIYNHKHLRLLDKLYDPSEDATLRKTALKEIEKKHGGILVAHDLFQDLTLTGTVGVFDKVKKILRKQLSLGSKVLSKKEVEEMIKSADEVIKECKDFKCAAKKLANSAGGAA